MKFDKAKKGHSFKNGDQDDLNKVNRLEETGEKYLKNILTGYRQPTCGPTIRTLNQYSNVTFQSHLKMKL